MSANFTTAPGSGPKVRSDATPSQNSKGPQLLIEVSRQLPAYTVKEAATLLRMSEKSVRRQIDRGRLRKCKGFGRVLIPSKDVNDFFDTFSS
jgi:excisionase family DNA binding protein